MNRVGAEVKSHIIGLGDVPHMEKLIGTSKSDVRCLYSR